jgi:hypothetical protein
MLWDSGEQPMVWWTDEQIRSFVRSQAVVRPKMNYMLGGAVAEWQDNMATVHCDLQGCPVTRSRLVM